jgi:hypothetical protein
MKRLLRFITIVWVLAIGASVALMGWPLIMDAWAGARWVRTECRDAESGLYLYMANDKLYLSRHQDFWQMGMLADVGVSSNIGGPATGTCWVNPRNPKEAVRRLDTLGNWSNSGDRVRGVVMLLAAAAGMTVLERLAAKRRRAAGSKV